MENNIADLPTSDELTPNDIDSIFGADEVNEEHSGSFTPSDSDKASAAPSKEQDDEFTGLSHEDIIKKLQSTKDKYRTQLEIANKKVETLQPLEQFYSSLYEDAEVRRAFIAELEPDLVKPKDPYDVLKEQLEKEFGQDYTPDEEEAKKAFSTSWKYNRKMDDLLAKVKENNTLPKSLSELKENRKKQRELLKQQQAEEKVKLLAQMKWQDDSYNNFADWAGKLSSVDLAKIYTFAMRKQGKAPNMVAHPGGTSITPNKFNAELTKFFG
jgi:hypothetical protein